MQDPKTYEYYKSSCATKEFSEIVPVLVELLKWDKVNENILDYGCGAGSSTFKYLLSSAKKTDSKIFAVDISQNMIEFAQENYSHARITFATGNILKDFPFKNKQFDKIFSIHVFHFIANIREALKGLRDILKPDGQMAFVTVSMKSVYYDAFRVMGQSEKWSKYMQGFQEFMPVWSMFEDGNVVNGMTAILEQSGFVVKHLELKERVVQLPTHAFIEGAFSINPFLKVIPSEMHDEYKKEFRSIVMELLKLPFDEPQVETKYESILGVVENLIFE